MLLYHKRLHFNIGKKKNNTFTKYRIVVLDDDVYLLLYFFKHNPILVSLQY